MINRDFDEVIQEVLSDPRTKGIPILFIIQVIIIMEDLDII